MTWLKPTKVAASAVVAAVVAGGCGTVALADSPNFKQPALINADERLGRIFTGGQGILRSSRALGTFAINSVDYKLTSLKHTIRRPFTKQGHQYDDHSAELHRRSATRLLRLCEANRGIYIKAGQFVATLQQLPREYRTTLSVLQDQARGRPFKAIDKVFKKEFGRSALDIFEEFEPVPIAAASLAQVHRARLRDGREVAVKVQYPGLARQVHTDIVTMALLSKAVSWFFPEYQMSWMVPQFTDNLNQQLDFEKEGRNAQITAANFQHKPEVKIPKVHWELTTKRILTMEFMHGCKVDSVEEIEAQGIDPIKVASLLVEVFAEMVFCHGHLHGDPHPGNVLIRPTAAPHIHGRNFELVLLDHGLYRDLDEKFRVDFCRLWRALILCDQREVEHMGTVLGSGKYSRYLPALFTSRSFSSNSEWGQRMSKDEERALRKELSLSELSTVVENLPEDLFLVLRTDNLIRQHITKLGASPKLRLVTNGKFAVMGLAWQREQRGVSHPSLLLQAWAYADCMHLSFRIYLWELFVSLRNSVRRTKVFVSELERTLYEWLECMFGSHRRVST